MLEVHKLAKRYPMTKGAVVRRADRHGHRRRRDQLRHPRGRGARPGRRVRLRQDDHAHGDPRAAAAQGARSSCWAGRRPSPGAMAAPPRHPGGLPGPAGVAGPAHDGRRHHRRAAAHPRRSRDAERERVRSCSRWSAWSPSTPTGTRTSSPAASASASASPARSRWSRAARARRAGLGARRLHPGRRHQPAGGAEGPAAACPTCSSRTTWRWSGTSPTGSPSCTSGRIVEIGDADDVFERPAHPYTQALLSGDADPRPALSGSASGSCCAAICPTRRTRRRAAASGPAARCSPSWGRGRRRPCIEVDPAAAASGSGEVDSAVNRPADG